MTNDRELVVLAAEDGTAIGTAPKASVHSTDTPLHFAFSCYVLNAQGQLLLTRRALSKKTWPGVWTNSFCGHPAPDEETVHAVVRRGADELGLAPGALTDINVVDPDFRYRAVDSGGIVENELCPVFAAHLAKGIEPDPVPAEVDSLAWVDPKQLILAVEATPFAFSPWLSEELANPRLRQALGAKSVE